MLTNLDTAENKRKIFKWLDYQQGSDKQLIQMGLTLKLLNKRGQHETKISKDNQIDNNILRNARLWLGCDIQSTYDA